MKKKSDNGNVLFKAGLFIIFTLGLLIFSILWLRFFSLVPDKTIIAKFQECGPIPKGIPVYYHGVNIGKINNVDFSDDLRYTLIEILIFRKKMTLPKNVYAEIKLEGITGGKYVEILYPDNPSKEILQNKDIIEGRPTDLQEIVKSISKLVKKRQIQYAIEEIGNAVAKTSEASKKASHLITTFEEIINSNKNDIRKIIKESTFSATNIRITSEATKNVSVSPEFQQNIKSSVSNISRNSEKLDNITNNINKITTDVDKVTGNPKFQQDLLKTAGNTANISERIDKGDLNCLIKKTFEDTDKTINKYNCIGGEFSNLMSQKFLLIKLMFGQPGQNFQKCNNSPYNNSQCLEEEFSKPTPFSTYSCPNN